MSKPRWYNMTNDPLWDNYYKTLFLIFGGAIGLHILFLLAVILFGAKS